MNSKVIIQDNLNLLSGLCWPKFISLDQIKTAHRRRNWFCLYSQSQVQATCNLAVCISSVWSWHCQRFSFNGGEESVFPTPRPPTGPPSTPYHLNPLSNPFLCLRKRKVITKKGAKLGHSLLCVNHGWYFLCLLKLKTIGTRKQLIIYNGKSI